MPTVMLKPNLNQLKLILKVYLLVVIWLTMFIVKQSQPQEQVVKQR
jgi:hypothetical protein